ncbi:kinase-like domain-containing protein [Rhizophagus irregularis DAOM 181602=DAOM 197198]|nr:kinase-like domain-containing protein [Rhizophagus irregularis DAOM 181602=DAOM 197198]
MQRIGNHEVDKFIQKVQLKAKDYYDVLEWIEYDRFENVEYLAKGGFGTIYKAIWKDGRIEQWDYENNKWIRSKYWFRKYEKFPVVLKYLHNSQDITSNFLREIETHIMIPNDAKELESLLSDLRYSSKNHEINKQIEEADKINEKLRSSSSSYTGPILSYTTNPQAVYTSRLLDFKNLPEPKNAIDNKDDDNSFGEHSGSIEALDFTKLDLDKNN